MPRKILAPHKEQDGYAYYRLPNSNLPRRVFIRAMEIIGIGLGMDEPWYPDDAPSQRIISSRRVEEAVETADFLKLLTSEGLYASYWPDGQWIVASAGDGVCSSQGKTIREAYYRYRAEAELDAQQPGPFGDETEPADVETESTYGETAKESRFCYICQYDTTPEQEEPCYSCMREESRVDDGDWTRPCFVRAAL